MKKLLGLSLAILMVFAVTAAEAAYVTGTTSGANISVGGDAGSANITDIAGDVVASYTSNLGNDTAYKTPTANNSVNVTAVYGDTVAVIGSAVATMASGESTTFTLRLHNYSNAATDNIYVSTDTASVTGANSGSVTITVNGSTIFQDGSDSFSPVILLMASGADTVVTVKVTHNVAGPLGSVNISVKTKTKNGAGGDPGGYAGLNGDNYAGKGDDTVALSVNVKQINVRTDVVIDSTTIPAGYNGSAGDSVPGMKIQYTVRYDNDGNDTAENFIVRMRIPANTVLADTPTVSAHLGAVGTVNVYNNAGAPVLATDPTADKIAVTFNVGVAPDDADDGVNTVGGPFPDVDAGTVSMRLYIK